MQYSSFTIAFLLLQIVFAQSRQEKKFYGLSVTDKESHQLAKEAKARYDLYVNSNKYTFQSSGQNQNIKFSIQDEGYMTSVKNQGSCGACVAFAWAATIEATIHKMKKIQPSASFEVDISEASLFGIHYNMILPQPHNCSTGLFVTQSIYAIELLGMQPEDAFPYAPNDTALSFNNRKTPSFLPYDFKVVPLWNYEAVKNWMRTVGPVFTSIAVPSNFEKHLILNNGTYYNSTQDDSKPSWHAVSCVGYDETYLSPDGKVRGAWICKNSWGDWGKRWGTPGYFRMAYGQRSIMGFSYGVQVKNETCVRGTSVDGEMDLCDAPHIATELVLTQNQVGWKANPNDPTKSWRSFYKMALNAPGKGLNNSVTCPIRALDTPTDQNVYHLNIVETKGIMNTTFPRSPLLTLQKLGCSVKKPSS